MKFAPQDILTLCGVAEATLAGVVIACLEYLGARVILARRPADSVWRVHLAPRQRPDQNNPLLQGFETVGEFSLRELRDQFYGEHRPDEPPDDGPADQDEDAGIVGRFTIDPALFCALHQLANDVGAGPALVGSLLVQSALTAFGPLRDQLPDVVRALAKYQLPIASRG